MFFPVSAKTAKHQKTARRLASITLDLIAKAGGCRGVNLRQIAAKARCVHTGIYHYYASLEDLFWAAVDLALERQMAHTAAQLQGAASGEAPLRLLLESQITFGQAHPSWYRLVWLEPLAGEPPPSVLARIDQSRSTWVRLIVGTQPRALCPADQARAGQLVHGYFHGEVCKLIGRHAFIPKSADDRERIVNNTLDLVAMITASRRPGKKPKHQYTNLRQ